MTHVSFLIASHADKHFFHANHLQLNVGDRVVGAFQGFGCALKGAVDVANVISDKCAFGQTARANVFSDVVARISKFLSVLLNDADTLGQEVELKGRADAGSVSVVDSCGLRIELSCLRILRRWSSNGRRVGVGEVNRSWPKLDPAPGLAFKCLATASRLARRLTRFIFDARSALSGFLTGVMFAIFCTFWFYNPHLRRTLRCVQRVPSTARLRADSSARRLRGSGCH